MSIHPGYMGYADLGGTGTNLVRFGDANITARQDVLIPDMVMGHWDRAAYNFGKVEIGGSMSGPVTETFAAGADSLLAWAYNRGDCGELTSKDVILVYFCDSGTTHGQRTFPGLLANSCTFSCAAGDVAQFSVDTVGSTAPTWANGVAGAGITRTEKLVTWDNVGFTLTNGGIVYPTDSLLSNFEFTIANNAEYFYALDSAVGFYPSAVIPGVRTITGSISVYDPKAFDGVFGYNTVEGGGAWDATSARATITFSIGPTVIDFLVVFHRIEPTLNSGPIISTVGWTAVGVQAQTL